MNDRPLRVRFAPSPTGMFHVGSARSALFNWCLAKQAPEGVFILRIEDTDESRNRPEWTQGIIDAMAWLGMSADDPCFEGPYFQSSFAADHRAAGGRLAAEGAAYYCDCTRADVIARTGDEHRGYDRFCRDRGLGPAEGRALRFRVPEGRTVVEDLVRGRVEFDNDTIEDFVLLRGDGSPMFLLANVVDDLQMRVSHVARAEEHLPNAPKQQMIWEALGERAPAWAHLPVLVNEQRKKLSKRRDKVALEMYRAEGYLPTAMRNYLMTLGWSPPGDDEIVPWERIIAEFRLEDVNLSPAFFDVKKLDAFNGTYIRTLPLGEFIDACEPWLVDLPRYDRARFEPIAPLVQLRLVRLADVTAQVDFLFMDDPVDDPDSWTKAMSDPAAALLDAVDVAYADGPWDADVLKAGLESVGAEFGLKLGKAQAPVRVAVTGRTVGPPLFESLEALGRDETLRRIRRARTRLDGA
jgi:glutamyl-tRNA synthetase